MITGGPDGDLGANQIQCYKGQNLPDHRRRLGPLRPPGPRPGGADEARLHAQLPAAGQFAGFPLAKLGPQGFRVPIGAADVTLPDGTVVRGRRLVPPQFPLQSGQPQIYRPRPISGPSSPAAASRTPSITAMSASSWTSLPELRFIVEGANVFFDDGAQTAYRHPPPSSRSRIPPPTRAASSAARLPRCSPPFFFRRIMRTKLQNDPADPLGPDQGYPGSGRSLCPPGDGTCCCASTRQIRLCRCLCFRR